MLIDFLTPDLRPFDKHYADAICLPVFRDERPLQGALALVDWRLCGAITRVLRAGRWQGELGQLLLMPGRPRLPFDKILLLGAGTTGSLSVDSYRRLLATFFRAIRSLRVHECLAALPRGASANLPSDASIELFLEAAAENPPEARITLLQGPSDTKSMASAVERYRRARKKAAAASED